MRTIKKLAALLVLAALTLPAQQMSDRVIVEKFSKSAKELSSAVDLAKSPLDCADIGASIEGMKKEFASHKELLDRALYPDDYSKTLSNLEGKLLIRQRDLGIIESQIARITELESQVRELSGKIDDLTKENDKLLAGVKNLQRAHALNMEAAAADRALIDSLSGVISKLRRNLKERDDLVFALLDTLFMQYDKDVSSMNDVEKQGVSVRLQRRNALTNIRKSIEDNVKFLESTRLAPKDYAEIARQNQRFASQWKGLGPKIANIYLGGKQKKNEPAVIDSMLSAWSSKVDQSTWKTLASLMDSGGIRLKPFANGNDFTSSFSDFVAAEIRNPNNEPNDVQRKRFNTFNDQVWLNELEPTWLPVLLETGKISADQKAQIEKSRGAWQKAVTPVSHIVYILGAVVVLVLLWSLARKVRKK